MKRGFSLVELSIVLVILGLLVGGILAGRSLIRASELRSISADFQKYRTAVAGFKDKYFAYPGDMANASTVWGAADGGDGLGGDCTGITTPYSTTATCNGNGDGFITMGSIEIYRMWQHLWAAGLLEGGTTGIFDTAAGSTVRSATVGGNSPASRISGAGYQIMRRTSMSSYWGPDTHQILFGAQQSVGGLIELEGIAITAEEGWNIDTKMDDGKPLDGQLRTYANGWFGKTCSTGSAPGAADYALNTTAINCALAYRLGI